MYKINSQLTITTLSRHIPDEIKNVQNKLNGTSYQPLIIH